MTKLLNAYRRFAYGAKPGEMVTGATAIEYGLIAAGIALAIVAVVNAWKDTPKKTGANSPPAIVQMDHAA